MKKLKGTPFLFLSFTLAGTAVIAARFITGVGTFTITAASLLVAIAVLIPFYGGKIKRALGHMSRRDLLLMCLQAFFGIFLFRAFLLFGLQFTSSTEAGILIGFTPIITCLLARFVLKERATGKGIAGIALAVTGIFLLQGVQLMSLSLSHLLGNSLVLCAAACESSFNILSRLHSLSQGDDSQNSIEPLVQALIVSVMAFLLCLIPALFEKPVVSLAALPLQGWLAIVWYGLLITMLSYVLWFAGIKRSSAYRAAAFSAMMPLTAMILSFLILKEPISPIQWLGGGMVMGGILLISGKQKGIISSPQAASERR